MGIEPTDGGQSDMRRLDSMTVHKTNLARKKGGGTGRGGGGGSGGGGQSPGAASSTAAASAAAATAAAAAAAAAADAEAPNLEPMSPVHSVSSASASEDYSNSPEDIDMWSGPAGGGPDGGKPPLAPQ